MKTMIDQASVPAVGKSHRTKRAIELAGSPRNHEGKRKWIICALRSARYQAELTIRNANRLIRFFESDLTAMATTKPSALSRALCDGTYLGSLVYPIANLLGIYHCDRPAGVSLQKYVLDHLLDGPDGSANLAADDETLTASEHPKSTSTPSAQCALTEANTIIAFLQNDYVEIDWSENPCNDQEATLRAAIIPRIELEEEAEQRHYADVMARLSEIGGGGEPKHFQFNWKMTAAQHISWKLRKLRQTVDSDEIGVDLYDAIKKWATIYKNERQAEQSAELRDLQKRALKDLRVDEEDVT